MKRQRQYIPINKGHSDLETEERRNKFKKIASEGWETDYESYRDKWYTNPDQKIVEDWPLHVDLELVSRCNLKCPMCPTLLPIFQELRVDPSTKGLMNKELAKKIITEIAGHVFSLRLSWVGESTLHPDLISILKFAKESGIPEVSFLTNGARLTESLFRELMKEGLDILTISVDGLNETYEKIRAPIKFDTIKQKIELFSSIKKSAGNSKPLLKIQSIWPAIENNPKEFESAIEFDKQLREKKDSTFVSKLDGELYLHPKLIPLDQVNLRERKDYQYSIFDDECDGYCGV